MQPMTWSCTSVICGQLGSFSHPPAMQAGYQRDSIWLLYQGGHPLRGRLGVCFRLPEEYLSLLHWESLPKGFPAGLLLAHCRYTLTNTMTYYLVYAQTKNRAPSDRTDRKKLKIMSSLKSDRTFQSDCNDMAGGALRLSLPV